MFYTTEEYKAHLEYIIQLLQTYENYCLIIKNEKNIEGFKIYVKEDLGAFVFKTSRPNLIFAINESNMTAAFWDYLNLDLVKDIGKNKHKMETIKRLRSIINEL